MSRRNRQGDVALIVGNGLLYDLAASLGGAELEDFPTGAPFSWTLPPLGSRSTTWRDDFPKVFEAIDQIRARDASRTDFDICDHVALAARREAVTRVGEWGDIQHELRHLLVRAFSFYSGVASSSTNLDSWIWPSILRPLAPRLAGVVSFNYDSVLEAALTFAGARFRYLGATEEAKPPSGSAGTAIPIWKIHGSANFDVHYEDGDRSPDYPPRPESDTSQILNRGRVVVAMQNRDRPRRVAEIVLPAEHNIYAGAAWQLAGHLWSAQSLTQVKTVVLAGLSFWRVDQLELTRLLSHLSPICRIIVVNPNPPMELSRHLKVHRRGYDMALDAKQLMKLLAE